MDGQSSPWRAPKPLPLAFSSTGALPRKHRPFSERLSLPILATPETPLKKERSKFVVAANLSPFAYSPHRLTGVSSSPLKQQHHCNNLSSSPSTGSRGTHAEGRDGNSPITISNGHGSSSRSASAKTKLSASYNAAALDSLFSEPSSYNNHGQSSVRSSSPITMMTGHESLQVDDVFGAMEEDVFDVLPEEEDPFNSPAFIGHPMELDAGSAAGAYMHNVPWKSTHPTFFNVEYFEKTLTKAGASSNCSSPLISQPSPFSSLHDHASEPVDYFEANFEVVDVLGSGSFSDVFRVRRKSDACSFALKRSKNQFSGIVDRQRRLQEVENMWLSTESPHCIQIYSSWEQHGYLYILMELCDNGSLGDVIDYMSQTDARFTEYQVWQILRQIAIGLEHMHTVDIVHLDIKPANVLINEHGSLKIGDFGLSMRIGSTHDPDAEGDKYYMAPETLEGCYDKPADIFSLGLLILELATDVELPAQGSSWQNLRHGDFSELSFEDVSDALNQLIKDMTEPDPMRRPTICDVLHRVEMYSERSFQPSSTGQASDG